MMKKFSIRLIIIILLIIIVCVTTCHRHNNNNPQSIVKQNNIRGQEEVEVSVITPDGANVNVKFSYQKNN